MIRPLRVAIGLALLFALALPSSDPVDLLLGGLLGAGLTAALGNRLRLGPGGHVPPLRERILWTPVFLGAVAYDVIEGTWDVTLRVLHIRGVERPGLVRVPIGERSERGVAVSALATTLSPGSVLVDVDWERGDMILHVLDASHPERVRERLDRMYDRYQRRVFP